MKSYIVLFIYSMFAMTVFNETCHAVDLSDSYAKPQVVNGDAVSRGQFRFMVALQRDDIKDLVPYGHYCGNPLNLRKTAFWAWLWDRNLVVYSL